MQPGPEAGSGDGPGQQHLHRLARRHLAGQNPLQGGLEFLNGMRSAPIRKQALPEENLL